MFRPVLASLAMLTLFGADMAHAQSADVRLRPSVPKATGVKTIKKRTQLTELRIVPENWLRVVNGGNPPWGVIRQPVYRGQGIPPQTTGVYLEGNRTELSGKRCSDMPLWADLDLAHLKANGFHVERIEYARSQVPSGYRFDGPGRRPDSGAVAPGATSKRLLGPAYSLDMTSTKHMCWALISARIWVRGPEGIDPVTGAEIKPSRAPN